MHIDFAAISPQDGYKIITNIVVPRPIAWVSTVDTQGRTNLAPFSFFNAIGSNPLLVVLSVGNLSNGQPKDTARNIADTKEFVVNFVTEELIDAMNVSAADFPFGESELTAAGLHVATSTGIKPPRVAEAQASLECTLHSIQRIGANNVIIGQVVAAHIADHLVGENFYIHQFAPIGRLGSPSAYTRTTDRWNLPRLSVPQARELGEKLKQAHEE